MPPKKNNISSVSQPVGSFRHKDRRLNIPTEELRDFMVFDEPDVDITRQDDGRLTVEIKGLDVYDPTIGQIRSHSTDDIACWFIDADYNEESFFVRHAYFCGGDQP